MIFLEKLITILSVLTVLAVGACVTFFTVVPKKSGMPDEVITSQLALNEWMEVQRNPRARRNQAVSQAELAQVLKNIQRKKGGSGKPARPVSRKEMAAKTKSAKFDNYVESDGQSIPKDEAVPGIPWIRAQPGVRYIRPKQVPKILYDKLQHFQDAYDAAQAGGGEFVESQFGPSYRINWVKPNSHLSKVAGLRPGDQILSVNGHKIGNSFSAARQLYDQLKNEKRFAVKVLREGQPTMLSFSMK